METVESINMIMSKEPGSDVLFVKYKENCFIDLESAKIDLETRLKFQDGKPYYVLAEIVHLRNASKEAREFLSKVDGGLQGIKAGAFVSGSVFSYSILNLFLRINRPLVPSRFFSNTKAALEWFDELRNNENQ